ncbi:DUF3037 domain-containing protein [Pseudoxanthomonas winnipegensis]|uniref:DUF3037 domain-containing protein n=1 Tax=Pseudoxanthomonas winnipegensis TaxID=2480810 RepID=UPI00102D8DCC|nr:DUF3037 domain-containing protein [Pseudoxanthomonas winnipegensis]TAA42165.1 DUF3037 domain-containing protein [Pseudoxanthomonas winnipegensis]
MTMRVPCQYAIVEFMPYPETNEFANVGVVLACAPFRYLGVKLAAPRRSKRITDFWEGLDARIYREAIKYVERDLQRISVEVQEGWISAGPAFAEITRPRETLIRYSAPRALMVTGHPDEALLRLFNRLVERDFATREYHEQRLTALIGKTLSAANLRARFKAAQVGNADYEVKFPYVHEDHHGKPQLVIKPLHLAQEEASKVLDHGTQWVGRIARLKRHGALPGKLLFAVDAAQDGRPGRAAKEIMDDLGQLGADILPASDRMRIVEFAREAQPLL